MKRAMILLVMCLLVISSVVVTSAEDGKVIYDGAAQQFVFEPGSDRSPTDLFSEFKDVMPGDVLTQRITVKNDASEEVKVKIYLRSLGARADSTKFLSELHLSVRHSVDNEMAYMFDAAASETDGLTDWVCLGTLYSGGEVNLDVVLTVPLTLGNEFQESIGYLDWEFKVEEFPVEPDDPTPPDTGDRSLHGAWIAIAAGCAAMITAFLLWHKKEKRAAD